jgi:hypothetical protein
LKSLRTKNIKQIVNGIRNRIAAIPWNILASLVRKTDSRLLGGIFRKSAIMAAKICRNGVIPAGLRKVLSLAQPVDPLKEGSIPAIDIVIPCHHKNFDLLYLTIEAARKCVLNPIGEVKLIANPDFVIELQERFPDCRILPETDFLTTEIMEKIENSVPLERRGWVIQQVVKFNASLVGSEQASLVLDADTILIRPRVWLDSREVQILCISEEYHMPYFDHYELVFGDALFPWSFVTHHQLMQKNVLKSMFGEDMNSLIPWLDKADFTSSSALSEYHTYGHWLTSNRPELVSYAKWNNTAEKIDLACVSGYSDFSLDHSKHFSVSCHSYL